MASSEAENFFWFSLDVSSSSNVDNLNLETSDDLDSKIETFTGYGNEPEYREY